MRDDPAMGRLTRGELCDICGKPVLLARTPYDYSPGFGRKFTVTTVTPLIVEVHEVTTCHNCTREISREMLRGASIMEALLALSAEHVLAESDEERSK